MRAFIAITLPSDLKKRLGAIQEQLKSSTADVKWVKPENIHLTLKFLGEIKEKDPEKIWEIMQQVAGSHKAYSLRLDSLGTFPENKSPRVIWVGTDKQDTQTQQIAHALEEDLAKMGIPKEERPFSSHITLGRVRSGLNREKLVQSLENLMHHPLPEIPEAPVAKLTLFKSTLTPGGPIYEVIKEASLQS